MAFFDFADRLMRNQLSVKVLNLLLSIALSLTSRESTAFLVALMSFIVSIVIVVIVASELQHRIASLKVFRLLSPQSPVKWKYIQYSYSLVFSSFNLVAFLDLTVGYHKNFIAQLFAMALSLTFLLDAILAMVEQDEEGIEIEVEKAEIAPIMPTKKSYTQMP